MSKPVAVGDDGRHAEDRPGDGPVLTAIRDMYDRWRADVKADLKAAAVAAAQRAMLATPVAVPVQNSVTLSSTGYGIIDLGGPQQGRKWDIRLLKASDAVNVTSSAGTATTTCNWYTGQPPVGTTPPNPASWTWTFATLPAISNFTSNSITVTPNDHLYAVISSGSASHAIVASALIQDYAVLPSAGGGFTAV